MLPKSYLYGDDVLELAAILAGAGDIYFGAGTDTLRFNGGSLLTTGAISSFSVLDVMLAGGTLGHSLTLAGENTTINLNGNLLQAADALPVITIEDSTTTLNTANNVRTGVTYNLSYVTFTQSAGGTLEFADHSGYAITAGNSTVTLHDIVTTSGQVLTGSDTVWSITDSNFANSDRGITLTDGSLAVNDVSLSNFTDTAAVLTGTNLTGSQLAFTGNRGKGGLQISGGETEVTDFRAVQNIAYASRAVYADVYNNATAIASASGGGVWHAGGNLMLTRANFTGNLASATAYASAYNYAYASHATATATANGGGVYHTGGALTLSSANFYGNIVSAAALATATATAKATAFVNGGGVYLNGGTLTMTSANFTGNIARAYASAFGRATATATANGGGLYGANAVANLENTTFSNNKAVAAVIFRSYLTSYDGPDQCRGGAIYLDTTTLSYAVTSGKKISNTGNDADEGGWLYMAGNSVATLTVDARAQLTIGDANDKDSIAGPQGTMINKQGTGYLLINSDISGYDGSWTVSEGTLELARIARTINLDKWIFGVDGMVILSNLNDTVNMTMDKKISILDLGGGSDTINTHGYTLSNGELRISTLTFTGGGRITSTIRTRDAGAGFDLTCANIILDSDIIGGSAADVIRITQKSTLGGEISLGDGANTISATAEADFKGTVTTGSGNDTLTFAKVTFGSAVSLGDGDDTLTFAAVTFEEAVSLGDGNNTLTVSGTADFTDIFAGSGTDEIFLGEDAAVISGELALGMPLFDRVNVSFPNGRKLSVSIGSGNLEFLR